MQTGRSRATSRHRPVGHGGPSDKIPEVGCYQGTVMPSIRLGHRNNTRDNDIPMQKQLTTLIKSSDAAAKLGISKTTIHRLVKAGKLECVQLAANSIYFTQQQLDEFVDRHRKRYSPNPPKSGKTA